MAFSTAFLLIDGGGGDAEFLLDTTAALAGVGGDRGALLGAPGYLRTVWPSLLHDIREALVKGDLFAVEGVAHPVKVAAQNVAARTVSVAALLVENMATSGEL